MADKERYTAEELGVFPGLIGHQELALALQEKAAGGDPIAALQLQRLMGGQAVTPPPTGPTMTQSQFGGTKTPEQRAKEQAQLIKLLRARGI